MPRIPRNARRFWSGTAHSSGAAAPWAASARIVCWLARARWAVRVRAMRSLGIDWIESPQWRPAARRWLEQHGRVLPPQQQVQRRVIAREGAVARGGAGRHGGLGARQIGAGGISRLDLRSGFESASRGGCRCLRCGIGAATICAARRLPARPPMRVAGGTPLADYAPVRAALELLAASVGNVPFVQFSALLRAPELQDSDSEASSAARLDVALRRRASSDADLAGWLDLAERVAAASQIGASGSRAATARGPSGAVGIARRAALQRVGCRLDGRASRSVPGRFAGDGRASNIKQPSDSASCSPA